MTREFEIVVQDGVVVWLLVACGAALCFAGGYVFPGFHVLGVVLAVLGVAAVAVALMGVM